MDDEKKKSVDLQDDENLKASPENETAATGTADDEKAVEAEVEPETVQAQTAGTDAIKAAKAEASEMQDRYLRLQADFSNYKKRTAGEKLQISDVVKMEVIQGILPVLDNFERALQVPKDQLSEENKSFLEGYEMIYKQLVTALEKQGLKKMEAVGKPFDPQYHEAVMRTPSDECDDDTVVEVLQAGYLLGDKTVRPAMVKVAFNG